MKWLAALIGVLALAGCGASQDYSIVAYGRENSSGTYTYFKEHVLQGADFAPEVEMLPGTAAIVSAVMQDHRAIGYGGIAYLKGVRPLRVKKDDQSAAAEPTQANAAKGAYPLTRSLYFYTIGTPEGLARCFIEFARGPEGQKLCEEVGYFPLPESDRVASPNPPPAGKQTLTVKGSDTLKLLSSRWAERFMQHHPDCSVQIQGGGSETGLKALLAGEAQIWQSSRPLKSDEAERIKSKFNKSPAEFAVGVDGLAIFVNEKNPIQEISLAQIRSIYTAKIKRWSEIAPSAH
jgi:ABC-type phosphate transport system substrate-binding protein